MASAFNICALVVHWRVSIPPGFGANEAHGDDVRDPKWCVEFRYFFALDRDWPEALAMSLQKHIDSVLLSSRICTLQSIT